MAWHMLGYVYNSIAYVAAPLLAVAVLALPSRAALFDILFPKGQKRRFAAVIFWVPLLAAIPFAIVTEVQLTALWTMSALSVLGVVLLSSPLVRFTRRSTAMVAGSALVVCICALLASPFVAIAKLQAGVENHAVYTRGLAKEVQGQWAQSTSQPLRIVESLFSLANSVTFYIEKKALPVWIYALTRPRWDTAETLDQFGAAFICPAANPLCQSRVAEVIGTRLVARRAEVSIEPQWFGFVGEPRSFVIDIVPPKIRDKATEELCCVSAAKRSKAASPLSY